MATLIWSDVKVMVGGFDLSGQHNSATLTLDTEILDSTVFGTATTRLNVGGLTNVRLESSGFADFAIAGVDERLFTEIGLENTIVTLAPEGFAEGDLAYFMGMTYANYTPGGTVGDLLPFSTTAAGRTRAVRGTVLQTGDDIESGNSSSSSQQVGAVAATETVFAAIHVFQFDGTTLDVDLRSDDNGGMATPTIVDSFTQATDVTSEIISVAGVNAEDFWDVDFTFVGTTCTFLVSVGILSTDLGQAP